MTKSTFDLALTFHSMFELAEIHPVVGLKPTFFSPKNRKLPSGRIRDCAVWSRVISPQSEDLNYEIGLFLKQCSKFLPHPKIYNTRMVIIYDYGDPTKFLPRVLFGKSLTLLRKCNITLEIDDTRLNDDGEAI